MIVFIPFLVVIVNWFIQAYRRIVIHLKYLQLTNYGEVDSDEALNSKVFTGLAFLEEPSLFFPYLKSQEANTDRKKALYLKVRKRIYIELLSFLAIILFFIILSFLESYLIKQ